MENNGRQFLILPDFEANTVMRRLVGVNSPRKESEMKEETSEPKKVLCFVCGKQVDPENIVIMSFTDDDMVCVCKTHIKFDYMQTAVECAVSAVEGSA